MPVIARPVSDSACCPAGCGVLAPMRPVVTVTDSGECTAEPLAVRAVQGQDLLLEWVFRNQDGAPIDLTGCSVPEVQFKMQEIISRSEPVLSATATINNTVMGAVRITIPAASTVTPGVFELQFALMVQEGPNTLFRHMNRGYLIIEHSMFSEAGTSGQLGPPPVSEILMAARTGDPARSDLLRNYEWNLTEVALAIAKPVEHFNFMLPPIDVAFNTTNFQFRPQWREAIIGELMKTAALWYLRDDMAYQGSSPGVGFADKAKWQQYYQIGAEKLDRFKDDMLSWKVSYNMRNSFGFIGTPYSVIYSP